MSLLDSLFKSNSSKYTDDKKLVECVNKITESEYGIFATIMDDLGEYINRVGENDTNMRKMSYAYARRLSAAGLCAQGIWGQEEYDYTMNIFHSFQQTTEQSVEFQETAGGQAIEYIQSYDSRLNKQTLHGIVAAISNNPSFAKNNGRVIDYDKTIEIFTSIGK